MMRVTNKSLSESIVRNLNLVSSDMAKANEVVSSGKKINRLSDDPVGLVSVLDLRSSLSNLDQLGRNLAAGKSWLDAGESALNQVETILSDAKALCVQMGSANVGAGERSNAVAVVDGYLGQILALANTQVGGRYIFGGTNTDVAPFAFNETGVGTPVVTQWGPQNHPRSGGLYTDTAAVTYTFRTNTAGAIGAGAVVEWSTDGITWTQHTPTGGGLESVTGITNGLLVDFGNQGDAIAAGDSFSVTCHDPSEQVDVVYQGNETPFSVKIGKNMDVAVGRNGESIFGQGGFDWDDPGAGQDNIFKTLTDLKKYLSLDDAASVRETLTKLDDHLDNIRSLISDTGAKSLRLDTKDKIIQDLNLNYTDRMSTIEDCDIAEAIMRLQAKELGYQACLASSSRVMQLTLLDYL
jgi:flagellar hook-associated protein 3 FlgL